MVQQAPVIDSVEPTILVCQHHWVIQPAEGPFSNGVCQVCGETRDFKNYVESATWGDTRLNNRMNNRASRWRVEEEINAGLVAYEGSAFGDDED